MTVSAPPTSDSQITVSPTVRDCQSDGINGSGGFVPIKSGSFTDTLVVATIKGLSGHWLTITTAGHWSLVAGLRMTRMMLIHKQGSITNKDDVEKKNKRQIAPQSPLVDPTLLEKVLTISSLLSSSSILEVPTANYKTSTFSSTLM